jgi:DNA-binding response OmpR family regulator
VPRILIVEDDPKIVEAIEKSFSLEQGFESKSNPGNDSVLHDVLSYKPHLVILDIKLASGGDGRQILKVLKAHAIARSVPVIFLTGMSSEGDRVLGLNLGADDYLTKPFGAMELLARIQAVLRRTLPKPAASGITDLKGLVVNTETHSVTWSGQLVKLQPKEFDVLALLAAHPGRTLTRSFLIENTSTYGADVSSRSLDTHIKNLRRKLGPAGSWIETVPKLGYCLRPPPE